MNYPDVTRNLDANLMCLICVIVFVKLEIISVFSYEDIDSRNSTTSAITVFVELETVSVLSYEDIEARNYVTYSVI